MRALNGQVQLELTDTDLEVGLGVTQPMHRKKLRLAIEERRRLELLRNPSIAQLSHAWFAAEWFPDLGLSQYAESFLANLVDARMLDTISKELKKYLGVTRKFPQASIVHCIHLLRIIKYDRQALAVRRYQCENVDADPLVWTNQRFMRWAHNIDLGEFAENLKGFTNTRLAALKPKHDRPSSSSESSSVMSLTQPYISYSPPIAVRTLSQLCMTYAPPPTLQEYEPIYTPLSLYSQSSVSTRDSLQRRNDIKECNITHRYGQKKD